MMPRVSVFLGLAMCLMCFFNVACNAKEDSNMNIPSILVIPKLNIECLNDISLT